MSASATTPKKLLTGYYKPRIPPGKLIRQGAEAKIFLSTLFPNESSGSRLNCVVKERFVKAYRQPELDIRLSRQRLRAEAKLLLAARQAGVQTPAVVHTDLDVAKRQLWLEHINGGSSSQDANSPLMTSYSLGDWIRGLLASVTNSQMECASDRVQKINQQLQSLAEKIGSIFARLHCNHIIHGDMTMANLLVKFPQHFNSIEDAVSCCLSDKNDNFQVEIFVVDFGLSTSVSHTAVQRLSEDKAVDLYVYERAVTSFLPRPSQNPELAGLMTPEKFVESCFSFYSTLYDGEIESMTLSSTPKSQKGGTKSRKPKATGDGICSEAKEIINRLDEVRLRGRKRLMIG